MDDRFNDWMKTELGLEFSTATFRHINPTSLADFYTVSKRIVSREKMARIDLDHKMNKLLRSTQQKKHEFERKKFVIKKPKNNQAWNVYANLFEKFAESEDFKRASEKTPDTLSILETNENIETFMTAWKELHDGAIANKKSEMSHSSRTLVSPESIRNEIPLELVRMAETIDSITV